MELLFGVVSGVRPRKGVLDGVDFAISCLFISVELKKLEMRGKA